MDYSRYNFMLDAPFRISAKCCDIFKKTPAKRYYRDTGRGAFIGTRTDESFLRLQRYLKCGENRYNNTVPTSNPLSIWSHADITEYIKRYDVEYCSLYDHGHNRTGCMYCMFGAHLEGCPNRFQKMRTSHPKQWEYAMRPMAAGGLGLSEVLDFIGVPYGKDQTNLFEFGTEEQ